MNWLPLHDLDQLKSIQVESKSSPVIIFKHSTTCSISQMAKLRFENSYNLDFPTYYLDLKQFRAISNAISDMYAVHHESPQVLLISNESCIYDASHFDISLDEIVEAASAHK